MDKAYLTTIIIISAIFLVSYALTLKKSKKCSEELEKKLRDNNERFRMIFDGVYDALLIHDIEGKILDANKNAIDMYGVTLEQLKDLSVISSLTGPNHTEERLKAIWRQIIDGEMAIFPWLAQKPSSGETFEVEVALRKITAPDQTLILATIRDLTEYNSAAAEIRKLAAVVEQVDESVVVCDKDSRIIYVNPFFEKATGYSSLEILGEKPKILRSGAHDAQFYKTMWETINSGNNWRGILKNRKKDGSLFDEEATIFPIKSHKSEITGYAAVKRDITQKMRDELALKSAKDNADKVNMELESAIAAANAMSEKAIEASRAKSEFIASVSHELRTPLNIILGSIELMAETGLDQDQGKYLKVCRNACESLLEIVSGILDISKIEAGQLNIESIEFEPRSLVKDIILLNEFRAKSKNLELTYEIQENVPEKAVGDPARIRQILINLVNNAIKFTDKGGVRIKIEPVPEDSSSPGDHTNHIFLIFSVSDTGIGIKKENIDKIFEEFIQADASITKNFGGTGLGLTISKKLVNLMGGRIWAESKEGNGSTFFFTLRCNKADAHDKKIVIPRLRKTQTMPEKRLRVLLAEDIADNRLLITKMISQIAEVETAENGAQAVEKYRSGHYDIVIMDIQMPELDGYSAARIIREIERKEKRRETPLIALTAFATTEELKKSIEAGFSGHVTKPVKKTTLIDTICITAQEHLHMECSSENDINKGEKSKAHKEPGIIKEKDYTVVADAAIEELIPFFLENRKEDILKLEKAIIKKDFETIMKLGHSLKGTGGSYGFHLISKKGAELEDASSAKDIEMLSIIKNQLTDYLDKVDVRFE